VDRFSSPSRLTRQLRPFLAKGLFTLFGVLVLTVYAVPVTYMFVMAVKDEDMYTDPQSPRLWPARAVTYEYEGEEYPLYNVPTEEGNRRWALVVARREESLFVDPQAPELGLIEWQGRWRTLEPVWRFAPVWSNFGSAWERLKFNTLLINTVILTAVGCLGTIVSSVVVAYGFARFRLPGQNILFALLIGTLLLPRDLLQIPLYGYFVRIGWIGTWLPLLVPQFFANALYVFLLRQHFRTLSKELDEAALIDGAGPIRILISVIVPQSIPVIATVGLLQSFAIWKDFYTPLLYLTTRPDLHPISIGIAGIGTGYSAEPSILQAASLLALIIPVVIFLFTQGYILKAAEVIGGRR
jgi:multiple sugar transport system permease protein